MKILNKLLLALVLLFFTIIFLYPLVFTLYNALVPLQYYGKAGSYLHLSLDNFRYLFELYPVNRWYVNTLVTAGITIAGNLIVNCMAGYALARFDFPGKRAAFIIVLGTMMVPYHFLLTPVYIRLVSLGWNDKLISIIVPFLFNSLYIFMSRQYFSMIPLELEEAARVDGLSHAGFFLRIALPISGPLMISISILCFTWALNSFLAPSTFLVSKEQFTLALGLKTVRDFQAVNTTVTLAGVVLVSIPILIVFLILQKHFVQGIASSGIKG